MNVRATDVHLKSRHSVETPLWGANLCGEVGHRDNSIAAMSGGNSELFARKLDAIARVPCNMQHDAGNG